MLKTPAPKSFYRRILPTPPAVAFTSKDGRRLFQEGLANGYMESYFKLAEQFRTQDE
jgi:glutathione gamma-glutamylcysteinyltransferase